MENCSINKLSFYITCRKQTTEDLYNELIALLCELCLENNAFNGESKTYQCWEMYNNFSCLHQCKIKVYISGA
jgi:hypothetical protein